MDTAAAMQQDLAAEIDRIHRFESAPPPPESEWYGLGTILRTWLGLPRTMPVLAKFHHAPHLETIAHKFYLQGEAPVLLSARRFVAPFAEAGRTDVHVMGALQVRYRRLAGIRQRPDAAGTLAFPAHASHHVGPVFDEAEYARFLAGLGADLQPVRVCLYWKDLLDGRYEAYLARGLPVVTAGHMFDPTFCQRLYRLLAGVRLTTGNSSGTHAVLSLEMGIPYVQCGATPDWESRSEGDPDFGTGRRGEYAVNPNRKRFDALLPRDFGQAAISGDLAAFNAGLHGCDEADDEAVLRRLLFRRYVEANAGVAELVAVLRRNPDLLDASSTRR
ncbi:MAG: hypothetical protein WD270_12150 [Acetobacterales bacterium]